MFRIIKVNHQEVSDRIQALWCNVMSSCTLCRTKIHQPDILYVLLRQSRDVRL